MILGLGVGSGIRLVYYAGGSAYKRRVRSAMMYYIYPALYDYCIKSSRAVICELKYLNL